MDIRKTIKKVPPRIWILVAIVLVGLFLRTYRFHDWLDFGSDQVNDAERVGAVVEQTAPWPSYGPDMGNSGTGGRQNRFRLGPIYYDFEIVSAKLFGNNPDSMAYPDLLFSVLSIPLLYLFLRKAFNENVSLALTGLSTISFSSLSFSHSAWNVNPIPFFSLLFLLSLYEFVLGAEKTPFRWVVALGVALGVGIQLHAILLVLFPATLFFTSLLFLRKRRASWKKLVAVIFIMILLNLGQLFGEMNNDFKNTRIFLASATESSTASDERLSIRIGNELSCTFQADTYILSSVGPTDCDFSLMNAVKQRFDTETSGPIKNRRFLFETILCVLFSVAGYGLLFSRFGKREHNPSRRRFFGLVALYSMLSFFVMLPVLDAPLRYFIHLSFLPFLFLGLIIEYPTSHSSPRRLVCISAVFIFLIWSNISSLTTEIREGFVRSRIILGQVEAMTEYMIAHRHFNDGIRLMNSHDSMDFLKPLQYVAEKRGVPLLKIGTKDDPATAKPEFYLDTGIFDGSTTTVRGESFDSYKTFGQTTIFHLIQQNSL
jgi:4-amino-4-deoxy-L-arabinose transferase-like glycosyltransferase